MNLSLGKSHKCPSFLPHRDTGEFYLIQTLGLACRCWGSLRWTTGRNPGVGGFLRGRSLSTFLGFSVHKAPVYPGRTPSSLRWPHRETISKGLPESLACEPRLLGLSHRNTEENFKELNHTATLETDSSSKRYTKSTHVFHFALQPQWQTVTGSNQWLNGTRYMIRGWSEESFFSNPLLFLGWSGNAPGNQWVPDPGLQVSDCILTGVPQGAPQPWMRSSSLYLKELSLFKRYVRSCFLRIKCSFFIYRRW